MRSAPTRDGEPSPTAEDSSPSPGSATAPFYPLVISEIGTLNEGTLHATLKRHYAAPGDRFEVDFDDFVVDLVKDPDSADPLLVEIQTGSFAAMGRKLDRLLGEHRILLVHPIPVRTMLHRLDRPADAADRSPPRRRRSPKRGSIYSLFDELVSIPTLLDHPNLALDVVLLHETRVQIHDPALRRRRGGYRTVDRRLDEIVAIERFESVDDLRRLLPADLPETFTTADIAAAAGCRRDAAQKLAYCFRAASLIELVDRTRSGHHYRVTAARSR